ncbi:MAG: hypothetical protein HQL13_02530 [Candidatus Omnitrophica bacterium]|nr:hypothetical protein [Candidatus Omnitrophota bacterium]
MDRYLLYLRFLLYAIITLGVYWAFQDFALFQFNTADASTYLNIAENICSHKGFVVSYNLYHFFTSHYYPIWPYMQFLYPLLCSCVFKLHGGLEQVIRVNIFILGLNAAFVFYIVRRFVPSRLNVFFWVTLVFSFNFYFTAFYAWTEQLHLLIFLVSFILFVRFPQDRRVLLGVGMLNGVLFLIRVAQIYSILAYVMMMVFLDKGLRQKLISIGVFLLGFLMVLAPFQLFNWGHYHALYPQYIKPAADYTLARISSFSCYHEGKVGIFNPQGFRCAWDNVGHFCHHLKAFYSHIWISLIPLVAYFVFSKRSKEGRFLVVNCLLQSVLIILGYCYSFSWNTSIDSGRYVLVPYVLTAMAGWFCLYELFFYSNQEWKKRCVAVLLALLMVFVLYRYDADRQNMINHPWRKMPFYHALFDSYRWIDRNLPKEVLIASNEDQNGFFMHRPFISTPVGRSYNCSNMAIYNKIYKPDYYLLSQNVTDQCFSSIAHTTVYANKIFRIYKVGKK